MSIILWDGTIIECITIEFSFDGLKAIIDECKVIQTREIMRIIRTK